MNDPNVLGAALRARRVELGLSLRDVAERTVGLLSWQAIGRIENGERQPAASSLVALARGLDATFVIDEDGIAIETDPAELVAA